MGPRLQPVSESPGVGREEELLKQIPGSSPARFRWYLRMCLSNTFPADAAGPGTTAENGCTSVMFAQQQGVPPLPLSLSFCGLRSEVLLRRN